MNYNYFASRLKQLCEEKKYYIKKIGLSPNKLPIYQIVLNKNGKKTVFFSAGIHGNESSGPLSILKFLKQYKYKINHPKIIILPSANPFGFENQTYENENKVNLNRQFGSVVRNHQAKLLLNSITKYEVDFFASFHEDDVKHGSYIYGYNKNDSDLSIYYDLVKTSNKFGSLCMDNKIYQQKAKDGLIIQPKKDTSLEQKLFVVGIPRVICMEVPDKFSMEKRIMINVAVMNKILDLHKSKR